MRQRIALIVSALTVVLLVALSAVFAVTQNPAAPLAAATPEAAASLAVPAPAAAAPLQLQGDSVAGRTVFVKAGCERCHSVAGAVRDSLSPSALRAKEAYARMPARDLEALLKYLGTLRAER